MGREVARADAIVSAKNVNELMVAALELGTELAGGLSFSYDPYGPVTVVTRVTDSITAVVRVEQRWDYVFEEVSDE